jgi:hypothetical protein
MAQLTPLAPDAEGFLIDLKTDQKGQGWLHCLHQVFDCRRASFAINEAERTKGYLGNRT